MMLYHFFPFPTQVDVVVASCIIRMNPNMLVWHYNHLILGLCHYLILVLNCQYVHGYALNIINIHFLVSDSLLTKHGTERLCYASTPQPNRKHNDSVLTTKHRTEPFHSQNLERSRSAPAAPESNTTLVSRRKLRKHDEHGYLLQLQS
jgi:hypothetical protein